jgi:hypothetical protein
MADTAYSSNAGFRSPSRGYRSNFESQRLTAIPDPLAEMVSGSTTTAG